MFQLLTRLWYDFLQSLNRPCSQQVREEDILERETEEKSVWFKAACPCLSMLLPLTFSYMYARTLTQAHINICTRTNTYTCAYTYLQTHTCTHSSTHVHTHLHMPMYPYTHTCTQARVHRRTSYLPNKIIKSMRLVPWHLLAYSHSAWHPAETKISTQWIQVNSKCLHTFLHWYVYLIQIT